VINPTLPEGDYSLVIRTDFSDEAAWKAICDAIQEPQTEDEFQALVECVDDKSCAHLTPGRIASVLPDNSQRSFVFLVDTHAIVKPDHPILVVDLAHEPVRTFRVLPSQAWGVENNLRLANMTFEEFAGAVDPDGVFRDFPGGSL
jgi:hypothetical protein